MTAAQMAVEGFLGLTALGCWAGALGMIRMRDPYQALHFLAFPALLGMGGVTLAVWVQTGWSPATWKCLIIAAILAASNSVGTHASARAFRAREKGHWEPGPNDREIDFLDGERR